MVRVHVYGVPMQGAGEEGFVLGLELQCLCFCIISLNQHALGGHAFPQHLRLSVVRYLDAEHQSVLYRSPKKNKHLGSIMLKTSIIQTMTKPLLVTSNLSLHRNIERKS